MTIGWCRRRTSRKIFAHYSSTAVALANKLARIAWAVLARDRKYRAGLGGAIGLTPAGKL